MTKSFSFWVFLVIALLSTFYLLVLGHNAFLALDDFGFVYDVETFGPWQFACDTYKTWSGRFTGYFVSGLWIGLFGRFNSLLLSVFVLLILGWITFLPVVSKLMGKGMRQDFPLQILASISLVNIGILSLPDFQTVFWLCTQGYIWHVYFTVALFYGLYGTTNKKTSWILVATSTVFLMCVSEVYTAIIIVSTFVCLLGEVLAKKRDTLRFWQIVIVISLLIIGFLIIILSPGNAVRMSGYNEGRQYFNLAHFDLWKFIYTTLKASTIFIIRCFVNTGYIFLTFPAFILLGHELVLRGYSLHLFKNSQAVLITLLSLFIAIFINNAICVFGLGWYAPLRSSSFISFLLVLIMAYWGLVLGTRLANDKATITKGCACVFTIVFSLCLVSTLHDEYPRITHYKTDIDRFVITVENEVINNRTDSLFIDRITPQTKLGKYARLRNAVNSIIGSSSRVDEQYFPFPPIALSVNPNDWKNVMVCQYFGANFPIIGWENDDDLYIKEYVL